MCNSTDYTSLLTAIIGGIIGIVGTYIGAVKIAKRQALREASDNFIDIFETIKATISQNPDLNIRGIVDDILKKNYTIQFSTMKTLSRRLRSNKSQALRTTWKKYIDPDNCGNDEPFISYYSPPFQGGKSYDRKYILNVIEDLISFAK